MKTQPKTLRRAMLLACAAGLFAPVAAHACATCGCSLSTDAAMGYSAIPGWRISLDYSYIPQNQLRSGTGSVTPAQVAAINDAGGNQEVERQTINRYINLVGETSKSRKGSSYGHVERLGETADPTWRDRVERGLTSGEGLIWRLRERELRRELQHSDPSRTKELQEALQRLLERVATLS